jgi:hypothetical protein
VTLPVTRTDAGKVTAIKAARAKGKVQFRPSLREAMFHYGSISAETSRDQPAVVLNAKCRWVFGYWLLLAIPGREKGASA